MLTAQSGDLLRRLKAGQFESADVEALKRTSAHDFRADVDAAYPVRFQERRLRAKWEVSAARSLAFQLASFSSKGAIFPILIIVPVFRNCLFLSGEDDAITGISVASRLIVRPIQRPHAGLALTTGRGFKLQRMLDGWELKPLAKRTVKLTDEFLQKRGWRFDALQQFVPKP